MDKVKRFIDCYVPIEGCTLRCHYCYITHHRKFNNELPTFNYSPTYVRKALSKERLGGTCLINFCAGGETLLMSEIVEYVKELLQEGHYVMIVTNGTVSRQFDTIASWHSELTSHLFFKFSYHYLQLKERKLLDRFFQNIHKVRDAGCSFTLEATPSDELVPYIEEMQELAIKEVGATCHLTVARDERQQGDLPILTKMNKEEYVKTWSVLNSSLFNFKFSIFGQRRKEFCYAGKWSFTLNLLTGEMKQCYNSFYNQNIFEDLQKPIKFIPIGNHCCSYHCWNGHAWLAIGDIPEIDCPNYAELRNKKCIDGSEWLQPEVKSFMQSRLWESNKKYSIVGKWLANQTVQAMIEGGNKNWIKNRMKRIFHIH